MKSLGFMSDSVINPNQQRKNFHMENVKPVLASIHGWSLWGHSALQARVMEDCNDLSFLKTTFNLLLARKQLRDFKLRVPVGQQSEEGALKDCSWVMGRWEGAGDPGNRCSQTC